MFHPEADKAQDKLGPRLLLPDSHTGSAPEVLHRSFIAPVGVQGCFLSHV